MEANYKNNWDYLGYKEYENIPYYDRPDGPWHNTLVTKINHISNQIHMKTRMGGGNVLKVNKKIFGLLKTLKYFKSNYELGCYMVGHYKIVLDESLDDAVYVIYESEHTKKLKEQNLIECYKTIQEENEFNRIVFSFYIKDSELHKKALENIENVFLTDDCYVGKVVVLNYNPDENELKFNYETGEINLENINYPINRDIFIPSPNYDESVDTLPGVNNLSTIDSLQYFFDKFLNSVEKGKPNVKAARHLKTYIDSIIIKDSTMMRFNILDNSFKQKFVIPIGKLDEEETKSFITKIKEIFKK
jgi:hypothetical protein